MEGRELPKEPGVENKAFNINLNFCKICEKEIMENEVCGYCLLPEEVIKEKSEIRIEK